MKMNSQFCCKQIWNQTGQDTINNDGCISDLPEAIGIFSEPKSLINGYIHHAIFKSLAKENISIPRWVCWRFCYQSWILSITPIC